MDPVPRRDAPKEPETPRDPKRESLDEDAISIIDDDLEKARVEALEAQHRFQALQRWSQDKATPPVPASKPADTMPREVRTPRQEHPASPPLPEEQRGPAPPLLAGPVPPAAPAPQPALAPAPAQPEPRAQQHQEQHSPESSLSRRRIPPSLRTGDVSDTRTRSPR